MLNIIYRMASTVRRPCDGEITVRTRGPGDDPPRYPKIALCLRALEESIIYKPRATGPEVTFASDSTSTPAVPTTLTVP